TGDHVDNCVAEAEDVIAHRGHERLAAVEGSLLWRAPMCGKKVAHYSGRSMCCNFGFEGDSKPAWPAFRRWRLRVGISQRKRGKATKPLTFSLQAALIADSEANECLLRAMSRQSAPPP